jgi:hypothetical protein
MIYMKNEKSYEYLSIKASFSNTEVVIGDGMSLGGKKQWPKEGRTIQWPKEEGRTIQWPKEEGRTIQWPKEGRTIQWPKEEGRMTNSERDFLINLHLKYKINIVENEPFTVILWVPPVEKELLPFRSTRVHPLIFSHKTSYCAGD